MARSASAAPAGHLGDPRREAPREVRRGPAGVPGGGRLEVGTFARGDAGSSSRLGGSRDPPEQGGFTRGGPRLADLGLIARLPLGDPPWWQGRAHVARGRAYPVRGRHSPGAGDAERGPVKRGGFIAAGIRRDAGAQGERGQAAERNAEARRRVAGAAGAKRGTQPPAGVPGGPAGPVRSAPRCRR